jgi:type IV pilus assembly protein PilB
MKTLQVSDEEVRELLVTKLEVLSEEEFESARTVARRLRETVGRILVDQGRIPHGFLLEHLAQAWGVPYIDLKVNEVKTEALRTISEEVARTHALVPFDLQDGQLAVAMIDPRDRKTIQEVERIAARKVVPYLAAAPAIQRAQLLYRGDVRQMLKRAVTDGMAQNFGGKGNAPPELLNRILEYAAVAQASDVHIEPYELEGLVRYRIDGVLHEVLHLPPEAIAPLVAHIKVVAKMRMEERRMPQDGRFETDVTGLKFDLRISTLPTNWGEKTVIRVLPKETRSFDLEDLGLTSADYQTVLHNILRPYGMILITGPTGAGKSTTLYAMLTRLGAERKYVVNISTVEDPVECTLPRTNQTAINIPAGVTFPVALRALLRQDPDIMMVGEIRDRETAEIAVSAPLLGRLLFSTLHTNDATGAIPRLIDMGVEPFVLASTLALVVSQRLVRKICSNCRESALPDAPTLAALKAHPDFEANVRALQMQGALGKGNEPLAGIRVFKGNGCGYCHGTGFRGRVGVFELIETSDDLRKMIMERKDAAAVRAAAVGCGMKTLFQDGLTKAFLGQTTVEEVFRVAV